MSRPKDKVIVDMRKIALQTGALRPSLPACLSRSLNFLLTHANHSLYHDFVRIICRPSNFSLSCEQLPAICHYNEKSIRMHCKKYADIFLKERRHLERLPLPLLVARLIEYKSDPVINTDIPVLRALNYTDLSAMIMAYPCRNEAKEIALILCNYFYGNASRVAI